MREGDEEDQEDVAMRPRAPWRGWAGVLEHGVPGWGAGGEQGASWGEEGTRGDSGS